MKPKLDNLFNTRSAALALALAAMLGLGGMQSVHAATYTWTSNTSSTWSTTGNWSGGTVALTGISAAHRLDVNGTGLNNTGAIYTTGTTAYGSSTVRGLTIGNSVTGTLTITGGSFSTLNSNNATVTSGCDVLGNASGVTGTLNVSGGIFIGSLRGTYLGFGSSGTGILNVNSGTATITSLVYNSLGTANLNGGTLEVNSVSRTGGSGTFNFNGGILKARTSTTTFMGGTNLTINVKTPGAKIDTQTYNITIGSALTEDAGSTGGGLEKSGSGALTLSGSNTYTGTTTVNGGQIIIATNQTKNGNVVINDTGSIKMSATATFKSGTNIAVNTGGKWFLDGTSQTVGELTGSGIIDQGWNSGGTDTLTVGSGDATSNFGGVIQEEAVVTPRVIALQKVGSGTLTLSGANTYGGTTTIDAGVLALSGSGTLGSGAALTLNGGALDLGATANRTVAAVSVTAASASGDTIKNGSLTGTSYAASNASGVAVISANLLISGSAGFEKSGAGTVTLSGTNTYTGGTTVTQGELLINGNISTSTATVKTTGTLGGSGTVGAVIVETGGKLAPGNSIDLLTVEGDVNLASGSTFEVEIDTAASYDTLGITLGGDLNITSGAKLSLLNFGSANLIALNSRLQLIDYSSTGGAWNNGLFTLGNEELSDNETFSWASKNWLINYDDTLGLGDTTLTNGGQYVTLTVVPEPRAALIGGLGLLALLRRRR